MANIKQAKKRIITNEKSRVLNQERKSTMRTKIKQAEKLLAANDTENAQAALHDATKAIDKAVQKGAIHQNNGNREKSRLTKEFNSIQA